MAGDAKNSAGSVAAGHGSFNRGPGASVIGRVKDAGCEAACAEVGVLVVAECDGGSAGGECALGGKGGQHLVARQFLPMLAVAGGQDRKLALDRIAQRETMSAG